MKILICFSDALTTLIFRADLMREMIKRGHSVYAVSGAPERDWAEKFMSIGVTYYSIPLMRSRVNPFQDFYAVLKLIKLIKKLQPEMVFAFQAKAVVYAIPAARLYGIKNLYALVPGLGSVFRNRSLKLILIRIILSLLYKVALTLCKKAFFQNTDDRDEFIRLGIIKGEKSIICNGSGINLDYFFEYPFPQNSPTFLFIGRLIRDKGVYEYLEAAQIVKKKHPLAKFWLVGSFDTNPTAFNSSELKSYIDAEIIDYLGWQSDVRPFLRDCNIFVLPSYHEGTPHSALEAMATGRPLITTDVPGCREIVINGVNGFKVAVKDKEILANKMCWMIEHMKEAEKMGTESLRLVRDKYNVDDVNRVILDAMEI